MKFAHHLIAVLVFAAAMPAAAQSVWDGVYTEEQAERGKEVYLTECVLCHAETLLGAEDGPALTGEYFREAWDGRTADELVERIRLTMPTDGPGYLTRAQSTDLTAYIFQDNGYPSGDTEMRARLSALKAITIEATKE